MKENDYFLNMINNPTFNESDFKKVGLTTDNTSFEKDKDIYKRLQYVQENPLFQTDGNFDEAKFNKIYDIALQSYNNFVSGITTLKIADEHKFYRNDIYAPYEQRVNNIEATINRESNPLRLRKGLIHANDVMESPLSVREIALTLKVWDESTKSWLDAPNESFFSNFFETRVLALWDEDGEHVDPFTGKLVKHSKGEKKINENGTFYYENLNGRDIYGREVLSKFDTLTVDGTFVNKFDFFDSDDKEKSITGNIVKNAIKVVPAFIPFVSPVYLGIRVGLNTVDLMAKLGKVFTGSDSPTLSAIEGFTKSLSLSTSDYAQGSSESGAEAHAWSVENLLNMGADTFTLLAELRWLFNFAPAIIKGSAGIDNSYGKKAAEKIKIDAWKAANPNKSLLERLAIILNSGKKPAESKEVMARLFGDYEALSHEIGERALRDYMKDYNELGKIISLAYMTGITVGDAYGEAKQEGASDAEAALLTLGYALGEYKLLNSDIGQWILPELKSEKRRFQHIAKTLFDNPKPHKSAPVLEKMNWINKVINLGKKAADKVYNNTTSAILPSMGAGAIAEGVEEISEEVLYDVSKSIFNVIGYLRGDDTRLSSFEDMTNRYALSFVGGALGGSIASIDSGFRESKVIKNIKDKDLAFQHLVHIVKEGKESEFLATVDKMSWNTDQLSIAETTDENGNTSYLPGTSRDNLNKSIKDAFKLLVSIIKLILDANGAAIDDESLLDILTNVDKDLRYMSLQKSTFAAAYLQEFNNIAARIAKLTQDLNEPVSDEEAQTDTYKLKQAKLKKELKEELAKKDAFIKGERTGEFIEKALFEMSEDISSMFIDVNKILWIESREGKKISEISPDRIKVLENEWNTWSLYNRKDKLEIAFQIFKRVNLLASDELKKYNAEYFDDKKDLDNIISNMQDILGARIASYTALNDEELYLIPDEQLAIVSAEGAGLNFDLGKSRFAVVANLLVNKLEKIDPAQFIIFNLKLNDIFNSNDLLEQEENLMYLMEDLLKNQNLVDLVIQDINKSSHINYATKNALLSAFEFEISYNEITGGLELDNTVVNNIAKIGNEIRKKPYSPALDLLNKWSLSLNNSDVTIDKLINILNLQYSTLSPSNNLEDFSLLEENAKRIDIALKNIKLLKAAILAARTDGVTGSNRVGYNVTANELLKLDLAEIDKNKANVLLLDINKVEDTLLYYLRLHNVNTGQKLLTHHKVSVNKDIITFNKLKKLVLELDWPPSDWNGSLDLKNIFNDTFEIVDTINADAVEERKLNLNDFEKASLKRDVKKLDLALFKFFEANQDKLSDPEKLSLLLSENLFNFSLLDDGLLNVNTSELTDTLFVWWLATRAAINPDNFYKTYKDNFISGIAPIPGQEQAIMMATAAVLNGKIFKLFAEAYNISLSKKIDSLSDEYLKDLESKGRVLIKKSKLDSDVAVQFFRHFLIEGIAGSGKTSAVAKSIVNVLRTSDKGKELLNNIWFVHASKELAKQWAKELGYEDDYKHVYSREEYLEKISPGVLSLRIIEDDSLKLDASKLIQRPGDEYFRYNAEINKGYTSEPPSLIMMDEVTGFGLQDLLLSEDFAEHYGIMNLVFGDFVLDGLMGEADIDDKTSLVSQLFRGNFVGSIKLGDSLRTANGVKDYNNKVLLSEIYDVLHGAPAKKGLTFKWYTDGTEENDYQDATTILGDKVYTDRSKIEQIKADIDVLLKLLPDKAVLEDHEKLGFIYDDKNSEIYKYLDGLNKSGKYKNKILMKEGSSSLGLEADYYVIDLDITKHPNETKFFRKLYTGFTRAKKATIALLPTLELISSHIGPEESAGEFSLGLTGIELFSLKIKLIYDEVYTDGELLKYNKFVGATGTSTDITYNIGGTTYTQIEKPDTISLTSGTKFIYNGEGYTLIDFVKNDSSVNFVLTELNGSNVLFTVDEFINDVLKSCTASIKEELPDTKQLDKNNEDKIDIINDNENELNMLLYSFACNETGVEELSEDIGNGRRKLTYKVGQGFGDGVGTRGSAKGRVDGINGLLKLLSINPNSDGSININTYKRLEAMLNKLRSAALYSESKSEIIEVFKNLTGLSSRNFKTKLIFKSSKVDEDLNDTAFSKFFKSIKEKVRGLFIRNGTHVKPTTKHISIMFTEVDASGKEQSVLEIPLLNLTNPMTLMETKGFELVFNVVDKIRMNHPDWDSPKILNEAISLLETKPVKMSKPFVKLAKLYLNINGTEVLLLDNIIKTNYRLNDDDKITVSNIFTGLGPTMTNTEKGTGTGRHAVYNDAELSYLGLWISLGLYKNDSGKAISDIVVATTNNKYGIKVGHPFVFVSDDVNIFDPSQNNDEALMKYWIELYNDSSKPKKVKLVYVSPPKVSVLDYFNNVNKVYKKDEFVNSHIGSDLTSFNLLHIIMKDGVLENKDLLAPAFFEPNSSYNKLKAKILELASLRDSMSDKEFLQILEGDGDVKGTTLKEFAKDLLGRDTNVKSWKSFIQGLLRWYVLSEYTGGAITFDFSDIADTNKIQVKRMLTIAEHLKTKYNLDGIFYSPVLSTSTSNRTLGEFTRIVNTNYNYNNQPYTINGKIDSITFKGNVLPIVDAILNANIPSPGSITQLTKDKATYMNDNYAIFSKPDDTAMKNKKIIDFKELFESLYKDELKILIRDIVNSNPDIDLDLLIQKLKENNKIFISEIDSTGKYVFISLENTEYTYDHVSNTLSEGDSKYTFTGLDDSTGKYSAKFEFINPNSSNTSTSLEKEITNDTFSDWKEFIEYLSSCDINTSFNPDAIGSADDLIQFIRTNILENVKRFEDLISDEKNQEAEGYYNILLNNSIDNSNETHCTNINIR